MQNLLSFAYWFNPRPEPLQWEGQQFLSYLALILIVLGLASIMGAISLPKRHAKIQSNLTTFIFTNALIALVIIFVNYELTPYLRARFWYIIWVIVVIIWLWQLIKQIINAQKPRLEDSARQKEIKKYLP